YEEVQRFGKYHPDYKRVMKQIRVDKRRLDLNEKVAELRLAENELQDLMDQVSFILGRSVSEAVKIPSSNPFFSSDSS
ncbi:YlbF family regulator, partial [Streptococcus pneumoniae]|nr:YlbF family regulator [Streptococcus pneumoniae]